MATTWIVAADESRARVLQVVRPQKRLEEIVSMLNPEGRQQERELQTDADGRFSGHGGVGKPGAAATSGPASDREAPSFLENAIQKFAKEVGRYLDKARVEHRFDELVLVAPPKFLGMLRKELDKEVGKLVKDELPKDLSWLDVRDLQALLRKPAR